MHESSFLTFCNRPIRPNFALRDSPHYVIYATLECCRWLIHYYWEYVSWLSLESGSCSCPSESHISSVSRRKGEDSRREKGESKTSKASNSIQTASNQDHSSAACVGIGMYRHSDFCRSPSTFILRIKPSLPCS